MSREISSQGVSLCETAHEGLDESFVTLLTFALGSGLDRIWESRRCGQPEPNEQRQRLIRDGDMTLHSFHLPVQTVKTAPERCLQSFRAICRQIRASAVSTTSA
jgi:hypothetical protein